MNAEKALRLIRKDRRRWPVVERLPKEFFKFVSERKTLTKGQRDE